VQRLNRRCTFFVVREKRGRHEWQHHPDKSRDDGGARRALHASSFALHHLVSTDKAVFFQLAYEGLSENGMLLLIDAMREEDEDHELYWIVIVAG